MHFVQQNVRNTVGGNNRITDSAMSALSMWRMPLTRPPTLQGSLTSDHNIKKIKFLHTKKQKLDQQLYYALLKAAQEEIST
jgi:hypothetical protein